NKNMLFLDGKPMIFHTIHAAIESGCFKKENIFVSTDSEHYKKICETTGVSVLMRPKELATEFATSYQVNKHFLEPFPEDQVF
ncbi:acylneuraminate cytidylyltransferase, partial [Streptococcus ruminantium]|nr:acylneuraminate cytidylyltransferase [Streptococcus ruminantium]